MLSMKYNNTITSFFSNGLVQNGFTGDHNAEINDTIIVASEYDGHYVFADVVHVSFDRS